MTKLLAIQSNIGLGLFWVVMTSSSPMIFNKFAWHPHKYAIVVALFTMFLMLVFRRYVTITDKNIMFIIIVQLLFFLLLATFYVDVQYLKNVFMLLGMIIVYVFINSVIGISKVARSVIYFMMFMGVSGVMGFFLVLFGIIEPLVLYHRGEEVVYNCIFYFTNISFPVGSGYLTRVGGWFNEGGACGFYILHAILINKLLFDNRRNEWVLILTGMLSFSLAFMISVLLYMLLFYSNKRGIIILISIIMVTVALGFFIKSSGDNNSTMGYISSLTIERIGVNNRSSSINSGIDVFSEKPLWGQGNQYKFLSDVDATFMGPLVIYGLFGTFFLFLHVFYSYLMAMPIRSYAYNLVPLKILFIMFLNYLQRPFLMSPLIYIMLILIAIGISRKMSVQKRIGGSFDKLTTGWMGR